MMVKHKPEYAQMYDRLEYFRDLLDSDPREVFLEQNILHLSNRLCD
jgi:hypothetical protein